METRFSMTKNGLHIESHDKDMLYDLRQEDLRFKYARIKKIIQANDNVVLTGVIYPAGLTDHDDIRAYNKKRNITYFASPSQLIMRG